MDEQEQRKKILCGLDVAVVAQLNQQLHTTLNLGYNYLVMPLIHPRYRREFLDGKCQKRQEPITRSDLILASKDWNNLIIGKISPYLELDSEVEDIRRNSEAALLQELELASHLSISAILLRINSVNNLNLSRVLFSKFSTPNFHGMYQIWIHIPLTVKRENDQDPNEHESYWDQWNKLRSHCDYDRRLTLALEFSSDFPTELEIERWLGEPVKCLIIHTNLFLTNMKNYPVLSRAHQEIIRRFLQLDIQIIIKGKNRHSDLSQYCSYINFLGKKFYTSSMNEVIQGSEDYIQNALQPLGDHLETSVYEVFEKDPFKYNQYQSALERAISDKIADDPNRKLVVVVAGAGRGPLIRAVLNAADILGCQLKVYAVEKNPYAVNTLYALARELWSDRVFIIHDDMRNFNPEEQADIVVSELLGSFGDNELSPECLDGAQRVLKSDGISIPSSYTSWVSPIQHTKIYSEIKTTKLYKDCIQHAYESPCVVYLANKYIIDNAQPLFTFNHPNKDPIPNNKKYSTLKFKSKQNCVLTGFAGYFSSDLYKGILISIEPNTYSKDMMSWFPMYFPLAEAVHLKAGETIEVAFWRCDNDLKVWYEWCLVQPKSSVIHNPNGRSYSINKYY